MRRAGAWIVVLVMGLAALPALADPIAEDPPAAMPAPYPEAAAAQPVPAQTVAPVAEPTPAPVAAPAPTPVVAPVPERPAVLHKLIGASPAVKRPVVHGLGFGASFTSGAGFSYRRYFGDSSLQLNAFGYASDRGDNALLFGGLAWSKYLFVWSQASGRILPSTSALRLVVAGSWFHYRETINEFDVFAPCNVNIDPTCVSRPSGNGNQTTVDKTDWLGVGAGVGFEFGAIMQPGFSLSLDLLLTAAFDKVGVPLFILPLPAGSLIYSW